MIFSLLVVCGIIRPSWVTKRLNLNSDSLSEIIGVSEIISPSGFMAIKENGFENFPPVHPDNGCSATR